MEVEDKSDVLEEVGNVYYVGPGRPWKHFGFYFEFIEMPLKGFKSRSG